jgi:hypothetical protein
MINATCFQSQLQIKGALNLQLNIRAHSDNFLEHFNAHFDVKDDYNASDCNVLINVLNYFEQNK